MQELSETRRRFMTHFAGIGLGTTLAPGILWARMQDARSADDHARDGHRGAEALGRSSSPKPSGRRWSTRPTGTSTQLRRDARAFTFRTTSRRRFTSAPIVPGMTVNRTQAAVRAERRAGGEASGEPRGRGVLAGAASRRAGAHEAGHLGRADRDVSRAPASLQRHAEQRRHVPRRPRPRRSEARRRRDRRRQIQRTAARHSVGREGHHLGQGVQDHVGIAGVQGSGVRLRRQRRRDAARRRRGADREARHRRAGERRSAGSAGRPRIRGIRRRARADRRPVPRRRPRPAASRSASAPRRADRSSARRRAAASPGCVRRSAASAATA